MANSLNSMLQSLISSMLNCLNNTLYSLQTDTNRQNSKFCFILFVSNSGLWKFYTGYCDFYLIQLTLLLPPCWRILKRKGSNHISLFFSGWSVERGKIRRDSHPNTESSEISRCQYERGSQLSAQLQTLFAGNSVWWKSHAKGDFGSLILWLPWELKAPRRENFHVTCQKTQISLKLFTSFHFWLYLDIS